MGRSDVGLLNVPLNLKALESVPDEDVEQSSLEEEQEQAPPPAKPTLEYCPQCGNKLSPLDIKTNKCFKCWAVLDSEVQTQGSAAGGFEVHI